MSRLDHAAYVCVLYAMAEGAHGYLPPGEAREWVRLIHTFLSEGAGGLPFFTPLVPWQKGCFAAACQNMRLSQEETDALKSKIFKEDS